MFLKFLYNNFVYYVIIRILLSIGKMSENVNELSKKLIKIYWEFFARKSNRNENYESCVFTAFNLFIDSFISSSINYTMTQII